MKKTDLLSLSVAILSGLMLSGSVYANMNPYVELSGGYGKFNNVEHGYGTSGTLRLGLGAEFSYTPHVSFGIEGGIQRSQYVRLNKDASVEQAIGTQPVTLKINNPIDILLTAKYHFCNPLFIQMKAGEIYERGTVERSDINNKSEWRPEIQAGIGYTISKNINLIAYYQGIYGHGSSLSANSYNIATHTAKLRHLPSWNAGLLGVEVEF